MTAPKSLGARGTWYNGDAVFSVELSPDGRHVLTAGLHGHLAPQIFFAMSGERVRSLAGPRGTIGAFSAARFIAGGRLAVASAVGILRFWDVSTGEIVGERPMEPMLGIVDRESDRGVVVSILDNTNARFGIVSLDPSDRTEPIPFDPQPLTLYAFLTGGRMIGSLAEKGLAVWGADGRLVGELPESNAPLPFSHLLAVSPDRRRAVLGSSEWIDVWNLDERTRTHRHSASGRTLSITFFPDSARVLRVAEKDGPVITASILDVTTGVEGPDRPFADGLATSVLTGDPPQITRDGRWLVAPSGSRVAWWDLENGFATPFQTGHGGSVLNVALSHDRARLVASDSSGALLSWDVATGAHRRLAGWTRGDASLLAFTPDGRLLAGSTQAGAAFLDAATGADVRALPLPDGYANLAATSDASALLRWTEQSCEIRVPPESSTPIAIDGGWDEEPPPRVRRILQGAWLSADGGTVLTHDMFTDFETGETVPKYELRLWNAANGANIAARVVDVTSNEGVAGLLPGGKTLLADDENHLTSFDVATGERVLLGPAPSHIACAGAFVLTGTGDLASNTATVLDVTTRTTRGTFTADDGVSAWAFGPRGASLVAAKNDGTFLIWDL